MQTEMTFNPFVGVFSSSNSNNDSKDGELVKSVKINQTNPLCFMVKNDSEILFMKKKTKKGGSAINVHLKNQDKDFKIQIGSLYQEEGQEKVTPWINHFERVITSSDEKVVEISLLDIYKS